MQYLKRSPVKRQAYESICKNMGKKVYAPILDVETRWNSTYVMLFRSMQMREVSLQAWSSNDDLLDSILHTHLSF
jgi:hypothetical protein